MRYNIMPKKKLLSMLKWFIIFWIIIVFNNANAQTIEDKLRVVVCTDISNEPDDQMSLIRFLTYSNEFDVEGLIPTTSCWKRTNPDEGTLLDVINAYEQVYPNLLLHSPDFPDPGYLRSIVKPGVNGYGMSAAAQQLDNAAINLIIAIVDKPDPRPVWFAGWGGMNTLGGAVMKVINTRTPEEALKFVSKIRVYDNAIQDDGTAYIMHNFPNAFILATQVMWKGISKTTPDFGAWSESWGGNNDVFNASWVSQNVQNNHGVLGRKYPNAIYLYEGDSPSILYLLPNGLGSPENPSFGSWGGRFGVTRELNVPTGTGNSDVTNLLVNYKNYSFYTDAKESWKYKTSTYSNNQYASIFRWREAFQNDFQARMDWCVQPFNKANHPPAPAFSAYLDQTVLSGATINLSAVGSSDPDGDSLKFNWMYYKEPGTFNGTITINNADNVNASFVAPIVTVPTFIHVILSVTDNGTPNLTRYKRIVVKVVTQVPNKPSPPDSLSSKVISSKQVNLFWMDTTTNEDGFKIERKTGNDGTFSEIGHTNVNVFTFTDRTVSENMRYFYRVSAYNLGGDSEYSNEVSDSIPTALQVISLSVSKSLVSEPNDSVTITLMRDHSKGILPVKLSITGSATNGADYASLDSLFSFSDGKDSIKINLKILKDTLSEGIENIIIKIKSDTTYVLGKANLGTISIIDNEPALTYGNGGTPGSGAPWIVDINETTKIEAENYNTGLNGLYGYYDTDAPNTGSEYRNDPVDIETCSEGGFDIGYTIKGEWLEYTIDVKTEGYYDLAVRITSIQSTSVKFLIGPFGQHNTLIDSLPIPNTGGWQNWKTIRKHNVYFSKGIQILRYFALNDGYNVNWFEIRPATPLPVVAIIAADFIASEIGSDPGKFKFSRNIKDETSVIYFSLSGTASSNDYKEKIAANITLFDGTDSLIQKITPIKDNLIEGNETLIVSLLNNPFYVIAKAMDSIKIEDDTLYNAIDQSLTTGLEVYPNPVSDGNLTINLPIGEKGQMFIYSSLGVLEYQSLDLNNNYQISSSCLTTGINIVILKSSQNVIYRKLIIKK